MSTFRNIFLAVAMFLFVGFAVASSPAMANEEAEIGLDEIFGDEVYVTVGGIIKA